MIDAQPIEPTEIQTQRDKYGMWLHPAFPWNDIPEETNITPFVNEWGYECKFISLENDAPEEIAERYSNSNDPDCSYWSPTKPDGNWMLGAIYDTEDGPVALWLRKLHAA